MLAIERAARLRRQTALLGTAAFALIFLAALAALAAPAAPAALRAAPAGDPARHAPGGHWEHEWARGAVVYEVDVRSFADGDGDGIGDLRGLTAKLDYLNDGNAKTTTDLGVDALCLSPIFRFPPHPEGDTAAAEAIDPAYGSDADFDRLIAEAHRRGMKVLVDLPMDRGGDQPMKAVLGRWLARGVDGFRLDATRNLRADHPDRARVDTPRAHAFLQGLAAYVKGIQPQALLVGEGWNDTARLAADYGSARDEPGGDELPVNLDLPLAGAIVQGAKTGEASGIAAKLAEILRLYPAGAIDAPFLTDSARIRLADELGGDLGSEKSAAAVLLTLPGAPFVDYGEELGLAGGAGGRDEALRSPLPWDGTAGGGFTAGKPWLAFAAGHETANVAAEATDPNSLLSHYRFLIRARHNSAALAKGDLKLLSPAAGRTPILAFLRRQGRERVLVIHNLGAVAIEAGPFAVSGAPDPLFVSPGVPPPHVAAESFTVRLPPHGSGVWRLR